MSCSVRCSRSVPWYRLGLANIGEQIETQKSGDDVQPLFVRSAATHLDSESEALAATADLQRRVSQ